MGLQILLDSLNQAVTKLLMRHLTTTVAQSHLGLVSLLKEFDQVTQLDLVIPFIGTGTELHFLDLNLLLLELGLMRLLGFTVLELAEVHHFADRRLRQRRNFHEVHLCFFGHSQGVADLHDAKLLTFYTNQPHFRCGNFCVEALRFFGGDVVVPCKNNNQAV